MTSSARPLTELVINHHYSGHRMSDVTPTLNMPLTDDSDPNTPLTIDEGAWKALVECHTQNNTVQRDLADLTERDVQQLIQGDITSRVSRRVNQVYALHSISQRLTTHMARYFDQSMKALAVTAFLDQAIWESVIARRIVRHKVKLNDAAEIVVNAKFVRIRMYELLRGSSR